MKIKDLTESATSGSTSSGSIASVVGSLNFPLIKRMPHSDIFGYTDNKGKKKRKGKK